MTAIAGGLRDGLVDVFRIVQYVRQVDNGSGQDRAICRTASAEGSGEDFADSIDDCRIGQIVESRKMQLRAVEPRHHAPLGSAKTERARCDSFEDRLNIGR